MFRRNAPVSRPLAGLALIAAVVIVCTWQLLTLVRGIFSASSLPWINLIVGALAVG